MPTATNGDVELYYETAGEGETVAFVEDAGYGAWSWGWQHAAVAGPYEAVVWDNRGVGRSDAAGNYSVAAMAADLEAVLAAAGAREAHVVGLGLGGMVALRYAREYGRAATLALAGTPARGALPEGTRADLLDPDPRASLRAVLSDEFLDAADATVARIVEWRGEEDAPREVRAAHLDAAEAFDAREWLHEVTVPALVLHGDADRVWPPGTGRELAEGLPRGEFRAYEGAGHLVTVERSKPVNDDLLGFLDAHG